MTHNYGIMRMKKITNLGALQGISNHTNRTNMNMKSLQHINKTDKQGIYKFWGSGNYADDYHATIEKHTFKGKKPMVQKNASYGWEIIFTATNFKNIDLAEWVKANWIWAGDTFGDHNVQSVIYHNDETTPHLHMFVTPFHFSEKMQRYVSGTKHWTNGPAMMRKLQNSYYESVSSKFDLERGKDARETQRKHTEPQVYREINKRKRLSFEEYFSKLSMAQKTEYALKASRRLEELDGNDKKFNYFYNNLQHIMKTNPEVILEAHRLLKSGKKDIVEPVHLDMKNKKEVKVPDIYSAGFGLGAMLGTVFALATTEQEAQMKGMSAIDFFMKVLGFDFETAKKFASKKEDLEM